MIAIGVPINFTHENIFMGVCIIGPEYRFDDKKVLFVIDELKKAKNEMLLR